MDKKLKILVLTDHSRHTDQNSIYAILREVRRHPFCGELMVASRGIEQNTGFYTELKADQLLAAQVRGNFTFSQSGDGFTYNLQPVAPDEIDMILMRLPRPASDDFLIWLEQVFTRAKFINQPSGIITTSNKSFLTEFPSLCPDTKLCHSVDDVLNEVAKYPIVLKPLREYGGRGLLKINGDKLDDGAQIHDTLPYLENIAESLGSEGYLSMRYLRNVTKGDKRILVINGQILGASLRLPAPDSWLCNVAQGGRSVAAKPTKEEEQIVSSLNPYLVQHGIYMYGVDTLMNDDGLRVLSEVNTLSIGGWPQAEEQTGRPIVQTLVNEIFKIVVEHE